MLKRLLIISLFLTATTVQAAKYAGDPLALGVGARALAMGGAVVAGPFDGSAAYWNPAGISSLSGRHVLAMHAETFGSLLNHDFIGYLDGRGAPNSRFAGYGVFLYYLGGGGIKITQLDEFNRPFVERVESHGDYLLAGSLAGRFGDRLTIGLTSKIIIRDVGTETGKGLSLDAGMLYQARPNLNLAVVVTDITTGFIRYPGTTFETGANYETIYPTVRPGLLWSYTYREFTGRFAFTADLKFEHLESAAQYWGGSLSLDTHYGWEIGYRDMVFGRAGFDIGRFTAGGGMAARRITVDFAYLHHSELDETFRVSAGYQF